MRPGLVACLLLGALSVPSLGHGQDIDIERATGVKAAALLELPKYAKWPDLAFPRPDSAFVIGVLGDDPLGPMLETVVASETVRGRRLELRRFTDTNGSELPPETLRTCHVLFVSGSAEPRLATILESLGDAHVLTVSDIERFASRCGIVGMAIERGRVTFKVNRSSAVRAGIKLKASLLQLADIVRSDECGDRGTGP